MKIKLQPVINCNGKIWLGAGKAKSVKPRYGEIKLR